MKTNSAQLYFYGNEESFLKFIDTLPNDLFEDNTNKVNEIPYKFKYAGGHFRWYKSTKLILIQAKPQHVKWILTNLETHLDSFNEQYK